MFKHLSAFILLCLLVCTSKAQSFSSHFTPNTLRLDYIFAGDRDTQHIFLDEMTMIDGWHGRTNHLDSLPLEGNGQITVTDSLTGKVIYRQSFSTLFQEWMSTEESQHTRKSFENVFLIPMPRQSVQVTVQLFDFHRNVTASMSHRVNPNDILIRHHLPEHTLPYCTLHRAADTTRCINIAFVAEGYTAEEMHLYKEDAAKATAALFEHEPFKSMQSLFHVIAVLSPSVQSGTSIPSKGTWKNTVLDSHFDTFYSTRYLTTPRLKQLHNLLAGTPYEHIIVLVNTEEYGGGGIYNAYNLSYTHGPQFLPVVVHEFGHSFGGLADEYAYTNDDPMYFSDTEPWEQNITTLKDFSGKWQNLIDEKKASLIEGGGYQNKGVWRGCADCRMRTNEVKEFCPVCRQALQRLIRFYTE
ncbi:MAG: M64 family metallopeptidase [Prevotella sp.]